MFLNSQSLLCIVFSNLLKSRPCNKRLRNWEHDRSFCGGFDAFFLARVVSDLTQHRDYFKQDWLNLVTRLLDYLSVNIFL